MVEGVPAGTDTRPETVPAGPRETKAGKRRMSLAPLSMDFAYPGVLSRPQSPSRTEPSSPQSRPRSLKSIASSPKKPSHYKHHEAAPRKLIRKLNSLLHGNHKQRDRPSRNASLGIRSPFNGSAASLSRGNSAVSTSSALSRLPLSTEPESMAPGVPIEDQRPFIKIRLATFNMHDTLPTSDGDFSDWLGDVSSCRPVPKKRKRSSMSSRNSTLTIPMETDLPKFPLDSQHPYHIIVVASQECPTASGVLAGRVRTLDGRGWTNQLENYLCGGSSNDSDSESDSESSSGVGPDVRNPDATQEDARRSSDGGDGGDQLTSDSVSATFSRSATSQTQTNRDDQVPRSQAPSIHGSNSGDSRRRRGPYVLVEKERLMGIYIAVFVARSCEDLIEGVSKSRVPAGLIGGRLGNKGGVAVSLHFASSRLLFVSAHLAAHASAVEFRKANVTKILEELVVDDFWESSGKLGPKPKNLTDRFDSTYFLGDLNFRLNVTRLHSDWLIARKDYATALRFDQLREVLLEQPSVFPGFSEGPIAFAPTYKYDVVHRVKKKRSTILGGRTRRATRDSNNKVPYSDPAEDETVTSISDPEVVSNSQKLGDDDTISLVSSIGTISTLDDFDQLDRSELDKGDLSSLGLPTPPKKGAETHMDAVRSAQVRFLTLVKTNSAAVALQYARKRSSSTVPKSAPPLKTMFGPPRPILQSSQSALVVPMTRSTSVPLELCAENPVLSEGEKDEPTTDSEGKKGVLKSLKAKVESIVPATEPVFDSSSKQRVQSYTDRILFKSTVEPPPEEEEEEEDSAEPSAPLLNLSRSSAFVSALRDLTHASNLRPRVPEAAFDRNVQSRRGSVEDRHLRFGDVFNRPRRKSVSSDSDAGGAARAAKQSMPRTKSLQPGQLRRHNSGSASVHTDESDANRKKTFWRRVTSFPALNTMSTSAPSSPRLPATPSAVSPRSSPPPPSSLNSPNLLPSPIQDPSYFPGINTASTPSPPSVSTTPTRRTPRKMFTISSDSPPSSPEEPRPASHAVNFAPSPFSIEPPSLPRANSEQAVSKNERSSSSNFAFRRTSSFGHRPTRSVSGSALPSATHSLESPRESPTAIDPVQPNTASLNTRFKSFLNSIPLPFLSAPASIRSLSATTASTRAAPRRKKHGPRRGEIQVVQYDSVPNLAKMGAVSDHRPVFLVAAVGV
ncbi:hypothetical protein JCM11491_006684 [Sporobolomyces phaffii]